MLPSDIQLHHQGRGQKRGDTQLIVKVGDPASCWTPPVGCHMLALQPQLGQMKALTTYSHGTLCLAADCRASVRRPPCLHPSQARGRVCWRCPAGGHGILCGRLQVAGSGRHQNLAACSAPHCEPQDGAVMCFMPSELDAVAMAWVLVGICQLCGSWSLDSSCPQELCQALSFAWAKEAITRPSQAYVSSCCVSSKTWQAASTSYLLLPATGCGPHSEGLWLVPDQKGHHTLRAIVRCHGHVAHPPSCSPLCRACQLLSGAACAGEQSQAPLTHVLSHNHVHATFVMCGCV